MNIRNIPFLLMLITTNLWAKQDTITATSQKPFLANPFSTLLEDTKDVYSPNRFGLKESLILGGTLTGVTLSYFYLDEPLKKLFRENKTQTSEYVSYAFEKFGNAAYPLLFSAAGYGLSWYTDDYRLRAASLSAIEAIATSSLTVLATKWFTGRTRPYGTDNPHDLHGPIQFSSSRHSFISGHTTTAFAFASSISTVYSDYPWVGVTMYSLATLGGISRIHDNKHWLSDVIGGAVVGTLFGHFIAKKNLKRLKDFSLSSNGQTVSVAYDF